MSEQQSVRSEESLRHEYNEVAQFFRHMTSMRFFAFSIFFPIMGGLGFVAFGKEQFDGVAALMARIAGVLVIAIFCLYNERLSEQVDHYSWLRSELESKLGYATKKPGGIGRLPRMIVIWRIFYVLIATLWVLGSFAVPLGD